MNKRPILFLDVDGVLNCYGLPGATKIATSICPVEVPAGTREPFTGCSITRVAHEVEGFR